MAPFIKSFSFLQDTIYLYYNGPLLNTETYKE